MAKLKKTIGNLCIIFVSVFVALLVCEIAARITLNPVDYLSPKLISDDVLGIKLPPGSSGHDAWGFRNKEIVKTADIVAIGDSHTYGNTARMSESWPSVLEKLTGKKTYNLGMGGYGPNQYAYLFETKALSLKPHTIICAIYMGDDFDNAFELTYGLDHWKYLRTPEFPPLDTWDIWEIERNISFNKKIRNWFSRNSMIYRLTVHGIFQRTKGKYQIRHAETLYKGTTTLISQNENIEEAFIPKGLLDNLNQESPQVREGMRITKTILKNMNDSCLTKNISFIVIIIPTKESVFSKYILNNNQMPLHNVLTSLIANETLARESLISFFNKENIEYIDMLQAMQDAVTTERLYAYTAADMHPNNNGYRVIAETIGKHLGNKSRDE